ncbi:ribokinase [Bacillus sp. 165]|uniref:ribokinase n=1 Tax=Bacillus sp. 165 TaxID=1529117 RepID=UPI001ADBD250|nr:ribokinase [Bacillus sp. 165]MBO9129786.1 ribokinase [Bacillus sp. 165]
MNKIVVIGSSSIDLVAVSHRRPKAGETVIGESFLSVPGGKGANQAVAAARLGANVAMIGAVGTDDYGRFILENFQNEGVNTQYVAEVSNRVTGIAHIVVAEGDNSIIIVQGANQAVTVSLVDKIKDEVVSADIVLIQLEIPLETVEYVVELCDEHQVPIILNPAPAQKLSDNIIAKATYITPNEHECQLLFDTEDINTLLWRYPNKLIMTEGDKGARFYDGERVIQVPTKKVSVVDTTGAGDTFNGALAVALSSGRSLGEAIRFANIAAALSVTKLGAQGGMPLLQEVKESEHDK